MKSKNVIYLILFAVIIVACSQDEEGLYKSNKAETRTYSQDKEILSHFLEIDTINISFHLNFQPKFEIAKKIPQTIFEELEYISDENKEKYILELNKFNNSIKECVNEPTYFELNTNYEKYLIKINASELNISLEGNDTAETKSTKADDGGLLGIVHFNTTHVLPNFGTVTGNYKVVTLTELEYDVDGFTTAEVTCNTGTTPNGAVVKIIRAASNTNSNKEHLHYWTNVNGTGNKMYWSFGGKFYNRDITSRGAIRIYEEGSSDCYSHEYQPVYRYYRYPSSPTEPGGHVYSMQGPSNIIYETSVFNNVTFNYENNHFCILTSPKSETINLDLYYSSQLKRYKLNHNTSQDSRFQKVSTLGMIYPYLTSGAIPLKEYYLPQDNDWVYITLKKEEQWLEDRLPGKYQYIRTVGYVFPGASTDIIGLP